MRHFDRFSAEPLPFELQELVDREIQDGERVLWTGQPDPARTFRLSFFIWLFAVPWTAFSLGWMVAAAGFGNAAGGGVLDWAPKLFALFGLPFVAIGLVMLSAPWLIRRKMKRTVYAVTDRRALIIEPGFWGSRHIYSFAPDQLGQMSRSERADGAGTLVLQEHFYRDSDGDRRTTKREFTSIPNVRDVENLIRRELLEAPEEEE